MISKKQIQTFTVKALFLVTFSNVIYGQKVSNYNKCNTDFSPIHLHNDSIANNSYADTTLTSEARSWDVIKRLNIDEKINLTGGWNDFLFPAVKRLGLPPVFFADASQGVRIRPEDTCNIVEKTTAFPASIALAATWNTDLANKYAKNIADECIAWGVGILLGPGINMYRNSEGGRSYEYYGEDPYLTSRITVSYIKGMEGKGVITCPKHFIANDQEFVRHVADVKVSEKALREIYLPPFKAAIKEGHALAIMTGNNFVNGYPGASNKPLTNDILRKEYGFKGVIMSDWASTRFWPDSLDLVLGSGQSLLMANNKQFAAYIKEKFNKANPASKAYIEKQLDTMVFHNLNSFFKSGVYDRDLKSIDYASLLKNHKKTALTAAEESITLLKNKNILPINKDVKQILVLGTDEALTSYTGNGSGKVLGYDVVTPLQGLKETFGENRVKRVIKPTEDDIKNASIILYFANKPAGEGFDIKYNSLNIADKLLKISKINPNIVVLYSGGNGIPMPWIKNVKGLLFTYFLGQEGGHAIANVLSGKVNPSGKLPFTIEKDFKDSPAYNYNVLPDGTIYWEGNKPNSAEIYEKFGRIKIPYKEGIYIGYRWYDKNNIKVRYPFGYGLSYTNFKISKPKANLNSKKWNGNTNLKIVANVSNTGKVEGKETIQLYIQPLNNKGNRAIKELKRFKKINLKKGTSKEVSFTLNPQDFSYWSEKEDQWKIDQGKYRIMVGSSSQELKCIDITYSIK
ncbi:beta-glucosidase [Tenacibaculum sp. UWU-22]|uniref:glycoside hydrolase family 3 protein n=1 Tax=Tenacibaculum sp. UWU-22 TaxID=3234187 RepID=UPI0034DB3C75